MDSRSILNLVAHNVFIKYLIAGRWQDFAVSKLAIFKTICQGYGKAKAAEFGSKFQSTKTVGKPSRNIA